jgi:endonuclease/exonuclease/phosphatase family metal-dependent hydrolase
MTPTSLKITTWNCARQSREKILPEAKPLGADFLLLQEITQPEGSPADELWIGANPKQGVSVISCAGAPIRLAAEFYDEALRYALPVEVGGARPFQMLAIWVLKEPVHYVPNLVAILEHYRAFIARAPTVVAGDFNANPLRDRHHPRYQFSGLSSLLENLGLESAYHAQTGDKHGMEKQPTYFHHYKQEQSHHFDYLYAPRPWFTSLGEVTVGSYEAHAGRSDHRPLSATFGPGVFAPALAT